MSSFINSLTGSESGAPATKPRITQLPSDGSTPTDGNLPTDGAVGTDGATEVNQSESELVLGVAELEQLLKAVESGAVTVAQLMDKINQTSGEGEVPLSVEDLLGGCETNDCSSQTQTGPEGSGEVPPGVSGQDSEWSKQADDFYSNTFSVRM